MVDNEVLAELEGLGATQEQIAQVRATIRKGTVDDDGHFQVWPENWQAVQLFLALTSQWRKTVISTMSKATVRFDGFDYVAVEVVMRIHGIKRKDRAPVFADLQVMEVAAANEMNARG